MAVKQTKTKLTPEQQDDILYWPELAKAAIVACDSQNRDFNKSYWKNVDFTKIDFNSKLLKGEYDNGIAVRLGKTLNYNNSENGLYIAALDFDGWDAVEAFFGSWENMLIWSKKTRIEWHENKGRLHMLFYTKRPITAKSIPTKNAQLEVRFDELLVVSPSINSDGNAWVVVPNGTNQIIILEENDLLKLEVKLDIASEGRYMSDDNKQKYIAWLETSSTKIKEHQGRHDAIKTLGCSYFYRYYNGWKDLTDDQRFDRLCQWNQQHCMPPLPEKEFNEIWKWILLTHRKNRDKEHEQKRDDDRQNLLEEKLKDSKLTDKKTLLARYPEGVKAKLEKCRWTQTSEVPLKITAADTTNNVIWKGTTNDSKKDSKDQKTGEKTTYETKILNRGPTIISCIPIRVTRHDNPLNANLLKPVNEDTSGDKSDKKHDDINQIVSSKPTYTIVFKDTTNHVFMVANRTLDQIIEYLKSAGYIMSSFGANESLANIIRAFYEDGDLVIDDSINNMGIYWLDGKLVPVRLDRYILAQLKSYMETPSTDTEFKQQVADAVKAIEELITKFRPGFVSTALKLGVIAPFNFALKQYSNDIVFLPSLYAYGFPRTGKNSFVYILAALYFSINDATRKKPYTSVNTEARLGRFVSRDTFPCDVRELKGLSTVNPKSADMVEMFKNCIETREARGTVDRSNLEDQIWLALRYISFTSNAPPPKDPGFRAKIIGRVFTQKDRHSAEEKRQYFEFMKSNSHRFRLLGNFALQYILAHPEVLFKPDIENIDWEESAKQIITKFYEMAGGLQRPIWLDDPLRDETGSDDDYEFDSINNAEGSLRAFLLNHFNETYNKYARTLLTTIELDDYGKPRHKTGELNQTLEKRINFCIDNQLTPYVKKGANGKIIIPYELLEALRKQEIVDFDVISSLEQLALVLKMEYGTQKLGDRAIKCVYAENRTKLHGFLGEDYV